MEVRDLFVLVLKRRLVVLLVFLLTAGLGAAFAFTQSKRYESVASIALTPDVESTKGFVPSDTLSALVSTYAQTARSRVNLDRAEQRLGKPLPGTVETESEKGTGILRVIGKDTSPEGAAVTARVVADAFIESIRDNRLLVPRLVNPATAPTTPVQPRPPLIIAASALLGLIAGIMLAYALEQFRRRVETPADVAEFTTAPVIGRLPRVRSLQRRETPLVWDSEKLAGLQEGFRELRTNIDFLTKGRGSTIQVTSPNAGQGKSTVVANLAIAFAQVGVKTLVLDADLRHPFQHRIFGVSNGRGLSTMMVVPDSGVEPLPTGIMNVSVLPSGPVPPNSTELLHIRFGSIIDALSENYRLILVDTPPLLPVSDARLVAPQTDGVVLVVSAGGQRPGALRSAVEKLDMSGAQIMGVVLNQAGEDTDVETAYDAYYYTPQPSNGGQQRAMPLR